MTKDNIFNTIVGLAGWTLANMPKWFDNIGAAITIISSSMGIIMLAISIRTAVINFRMKRMEYEKKKKEHEQWIIDELVIHENEDE